MGNARPEAGIAVDSATACAIFAAIRKHRQTPTGEPATVWSVMQLRVPTDAFTRLRLRDPAELCNAMDAAEEVRGFVTPSATFETLLQSLINHDHWFDAASLLAHAMAPRSSIWWATVVCGSRLADADPATPGLTEQQQVVELSQQWVREPADEIREAVHRGAGALSNSLPAYWVGMSVFWATGNITPDSGVVTPPPPNLYARGVSAALDIEAATAGTGRSLVYEDALRRGMDIAAGGTGETPIAA